MRHFLYPIGALLKLTLQGRQLKENLGGGEREFHKSRYTFERCNGMVGAQDAQAITGC